VKKRETPIAIRDSKDLQNILIQVNLKQGTTTVLSNFSAWENLALIMEALAVTAQKCADDGISQRKVNEAIKNYLKEVFGTYIVR